MIEVLPKWLVFGCGVLITLTGMMTLGAVLNRIFIGMAIRRLIASIGKESLPPFSSGLVASLPEPIQRYFHYALKTGQPNIRYAVISQQARFRHGPGRPWFDVTATEYLSGMEPGFVWDARLTHRWYWWRTAILSYVQGRGRGYIKLFGSVTLQDVDGPETNVSMLFRILSEMVWLPTGLLPTKTLRWEAIDSTQAKATIVDGNTTVTAIIHVNDVGQIDRIVTTDKYRDMKSGFEQTKFTLLCSEYQERDGVMIPTEVDFVWNLPDGDFTYGEFNVLDIRYYVD